MEPFVRVVQYLDDMLVEHAKIDIKQEFLKDVEDFFAEACSKRMAEDSRLVKAHSHRSVHYDEKWHYWVFSMEAILALPNADESKPGDYLFPEAFPDAPDDLWVIERVPPPAKNELRGMGDYSDWFRNRKTEIYQKAPWKNLWEEGFLWERVR